MAMYVVLMMVTGRWFVWGHCENLVDADKAVNELRKQGVKATSVFLA